MQSQQAKELAELEKGRAVAALQLADQEKLRAERAKEQADKERARAELALVDTKKANDETQAALVQSQQAKGLAELEKGRAEKALIDAEAARKRAEQATKAAEQSAQVAAVAKEKASEVQRTEELFESLVIRASLLADVEDYVAAKVVLEESRALDEEIPLARRHGRDFLAGHVDILGGAARQVYEGAGVPLFSTAVSPDGLLLSAVGENGTVVLFDVESGKLLQRLEGHRGEVWDVIFHPAGEWFATGGIDGQIIGWSVPAPGAPAEQLQVWNAPAYVVSLAVSPDGTLLASGGTDNDVSLWETDTGNLKHRLEGHTNTIAEGGGGGDFESVINFV